MQSIDAKDRLAKRHQVLHALREHPGASRSQIAGRLHLSVGTVRLITEELAATGLLEAAGAAHTGGRPSTRFWLADNFGWTMGVDLGEVDMRVAVYDLTGKPRYSRCTPFRRVDGAVEVDQVVSEVTAALDATPGAVIGVGLAVPGQLDLAAGRVMFSTNLGWQDVDLRDRVAAATGLPVYMERNSTAGMIGELWWGLHEEHEVGVYITMGSGVGSCIRVGDEIFRGEDGMAGEFGHVVLDPDGPLCRCGRHGCLETYASTRALQARFDALRGEGAPSLDIVDALRDDDPAALEVILEGGRYLARALATLVNLLNPGLIILSGQLMKGTSHLVVELGQAVRGLALPRSAERLRVVASSLGDEGMLLGAATIVMAALYRSELPREAVGA